MRVCDLDTLVNPKTVRCLRPGQARPALYPSGPVKQLSSSPFPKTLNLSSLTVTLNHETCNQRTTSKLRLGDVIDHRKDCNTAPVAFIRVERRKMKSFFLDKEDSENKEGEVFRVKNTKICLVEDVEEAGEVEVEEVVKKAVEVAELDIHLEAHKNRDPLQEKNVYLKPLEDKNKSSQVMQKNLKTKQKQLRTQ
ncbi:hypothetical protein FQA39_LY11592 [Lamprigera yunnana]|nr:hypothetical protein FQA39_LY11592 [Lamprigera yunnana]